jgi:S-adenosylmethionine synthetase
MYNSQYTVESVTSGHPDKVCDQVSDAILDALLAQDPLSRVAVETVGAHGKLILTGEVTTKADVDYHGIAQRVYHEIGHPENLHIEAAIVRQSPDIANGVDTGGAGDQGIMYGFATDDTPELMPLGVVLAHKLTRQLETVRRTDTEMAWLKPDGKSQVTINNGQVTAVVVSTQHDENIAYEKVRELVKEKIIKPVIGDLTNVKVYINPAGPFVLGGFTADSGLTGRKIMVDTYGGLVAHGGGAFSGKDATKVDRSAAYFARYVAKNAIKSGLGKQCLISVAYAIGEPEPVMLTAVNERGEDLTDWVKPRFDFRPRAIIERLGLRRPIYQPTAAYGHFGRAEFPWEVT